MYLLRIIFCPITSKRYIVTRCIRVLDDHLLLQISGTEKNYFSGYLLLDFPFKYVKKQYVTFESFLEIGKKKLHEAL